MLDQIQNKMEAFITQVGNVNVSKLASGVVAGKMLRSKLILAICDNHPKALDLCAIIEMIQSASLLHDDVIDESETRRGQSSVNAVFGNKNSIMLGDVFYAKAFFELTKINERVARSVSNAVVALARGEIDDVFLSEGFNPDKQKYFQMLKDKTASLITASAESAAILAGLDSAKYRDYGCNLGVAFQIIDDLLDVSQDTSTLGKPAMNDFKEGKTTLPYILLYECLDGDDKKILISYFKKDSEQAKEWLKAQFDTHNIIAQVQAQARKYGDLALASIKDENNQSLEKVVETMIYREF
ncbi:polyprenyl synthetase family protein [Helicobacter sp. 11S02596-1]|uniref:polyprenyl synthetase family protein n=1 Tax=Helicobacter sp. 11S02596-1 TaxID=1476194 RepID=UPI000BA7680D|nr:polyprenyl synthetase family protein [Helicobacter sp. 11S02596-1]PAF41653.1 hypothetical protein BJI48_08170 [Helicobacter sp. 11S02596-1]